MGRLTTVEECCRTERYRAEAERKKKQVLPSASLETYYWGLLEGSNRRSDLRAASDRRQINKDLPRTFHFLPPVHGEGGEEALLPLLSNVLLAYVERGRSLSATSPFGRGLVAFDPLGGSPAGAATTARGLLEGYPQGLNFLAGMSLLCAGGGHWDGTDGERLEESAFWLLALLLEDVLDPDFFGADVKDNLQMAYIGGLGMKNLTVDLAESRCPAMLEALGPEAFRSSLGAVLDKWVLSLFVGCVPCRLIQHLWDHLILPSPYHEESSGSRLPRGLGTIIAFSLAGLVCCGEQRLAGSPVLWHLANERAAGATVEDLTLEAAEAIQSIHSSLSRWPEEKDADFLGVVTGILMDLTRTGCDCAQLWEEVRKQKQRIADCTDNYDQQLMFLAKRTHFTVQEIDRMRVELESFQAARRRGSWGSNSGSFSSNRTHTPTSASEQGLSLSGFSELVRRAVPEFPAELCERLFRKLDAFGVGHLAFAELACGMSALALGTMDEKLQVCFDLFDSEGQRALKLKDLCDLCAVLFRVALTQGFEGAKVPSTDDILFSLHDKPGISFATVRRRVRTSLGSAAGGGDPCSRGRGWRRNMLVSPVLSRETSPIGRNPADQPWRSMLLRLLSVAQVRQPGGPWLVAFEDFRNAAHMEPALLCLFSWCLPRTPEIAGPAFELAADSGNSAGRCGLLCAGRAIRVVLRRFWLRVRQLFVPECEP